MINMNVSSGTHQEGNLLDDYLTIKETADQLGVSHRTLMRWKKNGFGPPVTRIGHRLYYRRSSARQWLNSMEGQNLKDLDRAPESSRRCRQKAILQSTSSYVRERGRS